MSVGNAVERSRECRILRSSPRKRGPSSSLSFCTEAERNGRQGLGPRLRGDERRILSFAAALNRVSKHSPVIAGLVPAIHVLLWRHEVVDARMRGHDGVARMERSAIREHPTRM